MLEFLRRCLGKKCTAPSLDSVRFDTTSFEFGGEPEPGRVRVWFTPQGDGLGLFLFAVPPDLPAANDLNLLSDFYIRGLEPSGGRLVDISILRVGGTSLIKLIVKNPQQPSGMTYVGSLTIPFRDFSFVFKVQCAEQSPTGMRDAVLLNRSPISGDEPDTEPGAFPPPGWNPDAEEFDAEFPDHPLSRARTVLHRVTETLFVEPDVAAMPAFRLPDAAR